jgi:hypothetical protein
VSCGSLARPETRRVLVCSENPGLSEWYPSKACADEPFPLV